MRDHEQQVITKYAAETQEWMMVRISLGEALEKYGPDLVIAATGAIANKGKDGEVRVIYDGTNGSL